MIKWVANGMKRNSDPKTSITFLDQAEINKVKKFHASYEGYQQTPLRGLNGLAENLGLAGVYVKDESYRFGLNAFKVLGGSFAMARYLAQLMHVDMDDITFSQLTSPAVKKQLGDITFVTATDGNHGRGVAWTANKLQQKAVVYMPKGSSMNRLTAIRAEGADVSVTDLNYDDAVRMAAEQARKYGWVMVQDTAWEGYVDIPTWIMQGYGTMAAEALLQLNSQGIEKPTHIFIQAGVGSLAGAVQGYFASVFGEDRPVTVVVEANQADCFYRSGLAGDGKPRRVGGDMATIMAGLACGEPNIIGWEVLRDYCNAFVSCPDWTSALGMRVLGNPMKNDMRVISGESGAVTAGLIVAVMRDPALAGLRDYLKLDKNSRVLLFSTEGDTDPVAYRNVTWNGAYSVPTCLKF